MSSAHRSLTFWFESPLLLFHLFARRMVALLKVPSSMVAQLVALAALPTH